VTVTDDFVKQFKFYTDLLAGYRDGEYGALLTPELKLSNVINMFLNFILLYFSNTTKLNGYVHQKKNA